MEDGRLKDLLSHSMECFEECKSPFSTEELKKMNVTSDEVCEVSQKIAHAIGDYLYYLMDT